MVESGRGVEGEGRELRERKKRREYEGRREKEGIEVLRLEEGGRRGKIRGEEI